MSYFNRLLGLVSWWQGEGNSSDLMGLHPGYTQGTVTFGDGKINRGWVFYEDNGQMDGAVMVPGAPGAIVDVGQGNGFTWEAWINPTDLSVRSPLVEWNDGLNSWGVHFYILGSQEGFGEGNLYADIVDTSGWAHTLNAPGGTVAAGVWQHVALTYDKASGYARIYCNGTQFAESLIGDITPQTSYDLYFGRRPAGDGTWSYVGRMDEIALYNRALSAAEIQGLAANRKCTGN